MMKQLIKPFHNRNAFYEDIGISPLWYVAIVLLLITCSYGAYVGVHTNSDQKTVTHAIGVVSVDTTKMSNDEIKQKISGYSNLSNLNIAIDGDSSSKYIVVSEHFPIVGDSELYSGNVTFAN